MIPLAICDDESISLEKAEKVILSYNNSLDSQTKLHVDKFQSGKVLLANVEDGDSFDIYVLDIEMPEMDGLSLARAIRNFQEHAVLIILTSHSNMNFTEESFKLNVLRYVNKMNMEKTLPEALDAAIKQVQVQAPLYLLVTHYHDVTRVPYQDIVYVHRVKRLTEIVLKDRQTVQDGRTLAEVYQKLDALRFVYVERGCFVNLDYVFRISGSEIILKNGDKLAVSRNLLPKVKQTIFHLWGGVK